jgi:hypothetical protein
MLHRLCAVLTVSLTFLTVLAPRSLAGGMLKAGLVSASQEVTHVNPDSSYALPSDVGFTAGLGIDHYWSRQFGLRVDLSYVNKLPEYISLDALALLAWPTRSWIRPYLLAGPRLDVELTVNAAGLGSPATTPQPNETHRQVIYGLSAGGGLELKLGKNSWFQLELQYQADLVDVFETATRSVRNEALIVTAGYRKAVGGP